MDTKEPKKSIDVEVTNEEPLRVEMEDEEPEVPIRTKSGNLSLPPDTTEQEDRVTEGQRRVNMIWETTQAFIAVLITCAIIYAMLLEVSSPELANAFFLIIGFYFSRTNHQNIGGVGRKAASKYVGR